MRKHTFKKYDHVIWDSDSDPEVCVLIEDVDDGFIEAEFSEFIPDKNLNNARIATHEEILYFYIDRGAVL